MHPYLIFTLQAPLGSFGTIAVGERRPSWDRPSKSQIVGFVAAALGIERSDEPRQSVLARSLGFAVRVDDPGQLLQDYHTSQRPSEVAVRMRTRAGAPIATRREELAFAPDDIKTSLSRREYRRDAAYTIALWITCATDITLPALAEAIEAPAFTLFLGRKANALMFPCGPVVTAPQPDILAAFAAFDRRDAERRIFRERYTPAWLVEKRRAAPSTLYADADVALPDGHSTARTEERRDVPYTRVGWRFLRRSEVVVALAPIREAST